MTTSIRAKTFIAIFVAGAIAPVVPAAASVQEPVTPGHYSASAPAAAPAPADPGSVAGYERTSAGLQTPGTDHSGGVVVIRDGSDAVPFVAHPGSESTAASDSTAAGDGFDWGDAAIGAGVGLLAVCFAILGSAAISDRRSVSQPTTAVSQSA